MVEPRLAGTLALTAVLSAATVTLVLAGARPGDGPWLAGALVALGPALALLRLAPLAGVSRPERREVRDWPAPSPWRPLPDRVVLQGWAPARPARR